MPLTAQQLDATHEGKRLRINFRDAEIELQRRSESWNHRAAKVFILLGFAGLFAIDFVPRGQLQIVLGLASLAVVLIGLKLGTLRMLWLNN